MLLGIAAGLVLVVSDGGDDSTSVRNLRPRPAPSEVTPPSPVPSPPLPVASLIRYPTGLAVAADGSVLIADAGTNEILRRTDDGRLEVIAGRWTPGFSGDGGPAVDAQLWSPGALAVARDGTIYVADTGNNRVRAIAPDGVITTVAGTDAKGTGGDGGPAVEAQLSGPGPSALALGPDGTLYIMDGGIRAVTRDGRIETVIPSFHWIDVDGAQWAFFPSAFTVDLDGNFYIADLSPKLIAKFDPQGNLLTVIGRGELYVSPGSGLALGPDGIVAAMYSFSVDRVTDSGLIQIAGDFRPNAVAVAADGTIYASTVAGSGGPGPTSVMRIDRDGTVTVLVS